jgi:hypothetical protein
MMMDGNVRPSLSPTHPSTTDVVATMDVVVRHATDQRTRGRDMNNDSKMMLSCFGFLIFLLFALIGTAVYTGGQGMRAEMAHELAMAKILKNCGGD